MLYRIYNKDKLLHNYSVEALAVNSLVIDDIDLSRQWGVRKGYSLGKFKDGGRVPTGEPSGKGDTSTEERFLLTFLSALELGRGK